MKTARFDAAALRALLLPLPGVTTDVKWDDDLVFSVGGKMFACICLAGREQGKLAFKVARERFLEMTDRPGVRPAPYLARASWIALDDPAALPHAELRGLLLDAHRLVFAGLTKKLQREIGG